MRKLLYAILLSLGCFFTSQAQTVIFDPATFTGDLPME
jgi:fructosamine-3-kinase